MAPIERRSGCELLGILEAPLLPYLSQRTRALISDRHRNWQAGCLPPFPLS